MSAKKILLLFIGLALPVLIFVFLKVFGRNQFDLPIFHQDALPEQSAACEVQLETPYYVADSIIRHFAQQPPKALLFAFDEKSTRLASIMAAYSPEEVKWVQEKTGNDKTGWLKACVLLAKENVTLVLVDDQRRIRGYYNGRDREELDRLATELTILLKKY